MLQLLFSDLCPADGSLWCFLYLLKWALFIIFVDFIKYKIKFVLSMFMKWITGDIEDVSQIKMAMTGWKMMNTMKELPMVQKMREKYQ